jgi:hypothetical protein
MLNISQKIKKLEKDEAFFHETNESNSIYILDFELKKTALI